MSQYLYRVDVFNKKKFNPLSIAAFYSGESQFDSLTTMTYNTTNDSVLWNSIITPEQSSEFWAHLPVYLKIKSKKPDIIANTRNILWSNINKREKREDSQFARVIEVAIPYFFKKEEALEILEKFAKTLSAEGMIVDASLHKKTSNKNLADIYEGKESDEKTEEEPQKMFDYSGNLLCTLRTLNYGNFAGKNRDWNSHDKMILWRQKWLELLLDKLNNSDYQEDEINNWKQKLTIYPSIKSKLKL